MKENKSIGPNLKTYYYYTNCKAEESVVKGVVVFATGMEGSGVLYDEIGEYLDARGYAMYAIDEWQYGKTGQVNKKIVYKNWKKKDGHFAAYNIHALSVLAKSKHGNAPVYLVGNDFGSMLSLYLIKEFPEVIDKVVTIGWGAPRLQDYVFLFNSWVKKMFLYDNSQSKLAHMSKNKRYAFRFERGSKYSWLTSDKAQLEKIEKAGFIDTAGTIGHYYQYYKFKVKTPVYSILKKCDKTTPMLLISGDQDLSTLKGATTKSLARHYRMRGFTNVETRILSGRHQLLFETNRFQVLDEILRWFNDGGEVSVIDEKAKEVVTKIVQEEKNIETKAELSVVQSSEPEVIDVEVHDVEEVVSAFQEAEDDLLITNNKNK